MTVKFEHADEDEDARHVSEQAEDILRAVFEVADGPDFAYRYARDNHPQDPDAHLMEYWDVINVLKESI